MLDPAPNTYRDSAAGTLSGLEESGGAVPLEPPRSRNRFVPSYRPNQRGSGSLLERPVIYGFGGGAEPPKDRGWERERVSNQAFALPGCMSEDAMGRSRHRFLWAS
jgi:hypothetical protein